MTWLFIIGGIILVCYVLYELLTSYKKDSLDHYGRVTGLEAEKYSKDMNRFGARKETKAAEARSNLAGQLSSEAANVTNLYQQQGAAQQAAFDVDYVIPRAQEVREQEVTNHGLFLKVAEYAKNLGLTVEAAVQLRLKELEEDLKIKADAESARRKLAYALIAKHLLPHRKLFETDQLIAQTIREIQLIKDGNDTPEVKEQLIAEQQETLNTLKEDKRGQQQRLIQAYQQGDPGGDDEDFKLR